MFGMTDLLRIGDFARLGRVSIKALRYYDAEGLLKPRLIHPRSGYRHYHIDQLTQLSQVTNLRAAGFSIAEIGLLMSASSGGSDVVQSVADQRRRLLSERDAIDAKIKVLDALSQSLDSESTCPLSVVKLGALPAQQVHSIHATVPGLGSSISTLFEQAESTVSAAGARANKPPFMLFRDANLDGGALEVDVCIPLDPSSEPDIESRLIPACDLACSLIYTGSYEQTEPLKQRMLTWLDASGLRTEGPLREIYHRFGADQADYQLPPAVLARTANEYITELALPVTL